MRRETGTTPTCRFCRKGRSSHRKHFAQRITEEEIPYEEDEDFGFSEGLDELGMILLNEIGGSMGPIYGTIFMDMAEAGEDLDDISLEDLANMLGAGLEGLQGIVEAQVGDKTLVDTLSPAVDVLKAGAAEGKCFKATLEEMKAIREYFRKDSVKAAREKMGLPTDPTDVEMELFGQTWSEHCKHKIFAAEVNYKDGNETKTIKNLFKTYIKSQFFKFFNKFFIPSISFSLYF